MNTHWGLTMYMYKMFYHEKYMGILDESFSYGVYLFSLLNVSQHIHWHCSKMIRPIYPNILSQKSVLCMYLVTPRPLVNSVFAIRVLNSFDFGARPCLTNAHYTIIVELISLVQHLTTVYVYIQ